MAGSGKVRRDECWNLTYGRFDPEEEKLRETLTTVGNGYFGTRGCCEGCSASEHHYPGTYLAGVYNKVPSTVHDRRIFNDDFVNCPNWLPITWRVGRGRFRNPLEMTIRSYEQNLDMRDALMSRRLEVADSQGRITRVESARFASMDNPHYAVISWTLTPLNYSAAITVRSSLDGTVINDGVARYRNLTSRHLEPLGGGGIPEGVFLKVRTSRSRTEVALCARNRVYEGKREIDARRKVVDEKGMVSEELSFEVAEGSSYRLEKIVTITSSRDRDTASPLDTARVLLARASRFDDMFKEHRSRWRELWDKMDIAITGDRFAQKVLRLHIYHLLATASPHNVSIDAGMPARGLHGEAYRGHVFWDSIYVLPFYYERFPDIARALLMYRRRRLDAARNNARGEGYEGAMFPWQSSHDGGEETQIIHYNPVSDSWGPDLSRRQRHVSIAIFYNLLQYWLHSGDREFLHSRGAEMLLEIARFWASIAGEDPRTGRFHIRGVMGPDEFHEKYPGAPDEEGGINDNAYTNIMVVWVLEQALELLRTLPREVVSAVRRTIGLERGEEKRWQAICRRMYVPITEEGIISQYEGYMRLRELDFEQYRRKYGNIHRMDRLLKSEGDTPDKYKVAKQADTLMLFYLLPVDEVLRILSQLGYPVKDRRAFLQTNYEFHLKHTTHGSTLSKVAHAAVARDMSTPTETWKWFLEALKSDIYDTQGGTTIEGIHTAVMGGTIKIVTRVFAGVAIGPDGIDLKPSLPAHWKRLKFKLLIRGVWYHFDITPHDVSVQVDPGAGPPLTVNVHGKGGGE